MKERDDWHLTDQIKHETGSGDPFAAAVRATRMPMIITDPNRPDNPIIFCNAAFQTLTGYDRDEIVGRNCRFLQGPDTDQEAVGCIRAAVAAGESLDVDILNYRKDGSTFWNALYLSPVLNAAGVIQFFFASQLDITDRVNAHEMIAHDKALMEREIERRTADLSAALEAKTLLLHEVDHRVKNNLTMIGSLIRLQARTIGNPDIGAKLEAMLQRVDALAAVHRRLHQSDDVTRFDVGAFTENLVADVIGSSGRTEIAVELHVESIEIPSGDAAAVGLILNEILTNAIKHAYADGRSGRLQIVAKRAEGKADIMVRDDGPGLPAGSLEGGGLGATLVKQLCKQLGATVSWEVSNGTAVTPELSGGCGMKRPSAPLNVLIVEDEALLAMDIEAMVEDCGHRPVAGAASLYDVEALGNDVMFDLALVDLHLAQNTSGLDVCRLIRSRWSSAFVVFVTANPKKVPADYCGAHGRDTETIFPLRADGSDALHRKGRLRSSALVPATRQLHPLAGLRGELDLAQPSPPPPPVGDRDVLCP